MTGRRAREQEGDQSGAVEPSIEEPKELQPAQFFSSADVLIVAGKGGVGKTVAAATMATAAARTGLSVLLVEVAAGVGTDVRGRSPRVRGRTVPRGGG